MTTRIKVRDKTCYDRWPEILNAEETAMILGIHIKTVRRMAAKGELPAFRLGVKLWRFRKSDIIKLMEGKIC